jgi:mono/diheme cytochrome c family protein
MNRAAFLIIAGLANNAAFAVPSQPPAFTKDIAPILYHNCTGCHRPDEVAPFPLLNYNDARKHAKQIAKVTEKHFMPPWKAEPGFGDFANERRLSEAEIGLIKAWYDAGAPEGIAADLPPLPKWTEGWTMGTPDLVLEPDRDYELAAEGRDVYRCFVIPTQFSEERFIAAMEMRPGNRKVVHHVLTFVDTSGKARILDAQDSEPGYSTFGGVGFKNSGHLGGWAPGNFPERLPNGIGFRVPKGADLVLQVHYHKSGKPEKDRTKVGLYFAKGAIDKQVRVIPVAKLPLRIPANESNFIVQATLPVLFDATIYSVMPHMHLLGREMKVTAFLPDGTSHPLVHVPDWNFNWQTTYRFKKPMHLPRGSRVEMEARFDNSAGNLANPNNPPRLVTFGEQTTDEMCMAFLSYTVDAEQLTKGIAFNSLRDLAPGLRGPAKPKSTSAKKLD